MKTKRIAVMILCLVLCVIMGGESILSAFSIPIMAEGTDENEIEYTLGYNDLLANKSFNPDDYPVKENDYSLEVITIAESENGELFVYVYQPSGQKVDLRATSINISLSERTNNKFHNYALTYLNSYGTFYKYKVKDLTVSSNDIRYYEIPSIFRFWNEVYDESAGGGNRIDEVVYPVGRQFTFAGKGEQTTVKVQDVEYIRVTEKYVGYIRYEQDTPLFSVISNAAVDAHFVAFSTDKTIDELLEADIYYTVQKCNRHVLTTFGDPVPGEKYLDYTQMAECEISDGSLWTHSEHIWKRIQRTSEFLKNDTPVYTFPGFSVDQDIPFTDEAKGDLAKTKWVLSFLETEYQFSESNTTLGATTETFSRVGNVSILRLKFKTDGVIYDLGVVDNKQTGSEDPSAIVKKQERWWEQLLTILMLILLVVCLSFLSGPVGVIFRIIWGGIKAIAQFIIWLLQLPFRLLRWIIQKLSKKSNGGRK